MHSQLNKNEIRVCQVSGCSEPYFQRHYESHANHHKQPLHLTPLASPNTLPQKIQLSQLLSETDASEMAIQSILPDQVPRPFDVAKKLDSFQSDSSETKVEIARGAFQNSPDHLQNDFSPMKNKSLNDDLVPLSIAKQISLKPILSEINQMTINKYKNQKLNANEIIDPHVEQKKQRVAFPEATEAKPRYIVEPQTNSKLKNTILFNMNREISPVKPHQSIDTKSNLKSPSITYQCENQNVGPEKVGGLLPPNQPNHPHQCPDCHGFWCRTCNSVIPPTLRPFWDGAATRQQVENIKALQRAAERQMTCKQCNPNRKQ